MTIAEHLEKHLGPMHGGTKVRLAKGRRAPEIFIASFPDRPVNRAITYSTLGLSEYELEQEDGGNLRQELLFSCRLPRDRDEPVSLLMAVAADVISAGRALPRGHVVGPAGPLIEDSRLEALYCAAPVYFDDDFHVFRELHPPVVFVLLIPITAAEAEFVEREGWEAFEDLLVEQDADLLDLNRDSIDPDRAPQ